MDKTEEIKTENEDESISQSNEDKLDPYFYTKNKGFTSELFKIEVGNLPHHTGFGQLRKLFNGKLNLNTRKIKQFGIGSRFIYVTFQDEEGREKALKCLDGYEWKGKKLSAKKAKPMADPLVKKREAGDSEDCDPAKKLKVEEEISLTDRLNNAVTPLWQVPYAEQLKKKSVEVNKFLCKLGREIQKVNETFKKVQLSKRTDKEYRCCPAEPIKASPLTSAYRNKCEFTVGRDLDTNLRTVGFRLNSYKEGSTSVMPPDCCINVSPMMLKAVKSFEAYVQRSDKDVYNPETHEGFWKQLTVRSSRNGDILIIVVMAPQQLSKKEMDEEKSLLKSYFEDGEGKNSNVTSVYFQLNEKKQAGQDNDSNIEHLLGRSCLEDELLGMTFQVGPEAFFQINPGAAELLYGIVAEIVGQTPNLTVLDLCCGTGTIGLILAKQGAKVIGVEMSNQAIENAKINAKTNDITSIQFLCGKAEEVIFDAIDLCDKADMIAVANPPRAGLHTKVVKAIRSCEQIKKLVYVSCNPTLAITNFIDLCRTPSNNYKGTPFVPIVAAPVDMFPQTPHYELVLVFERQECT